MRKIITLLALCISLKAFSLETGDVAIIGISTTLSASSQQTLVFVPSVDLPTGTTITFTDKAWIDGLNFDHALLTGEGSFTWRATSTVLAGDEVIVYIDIDLFSGAISTNLYASRGEIYNIAHFRLQSPEQIIAFEGDYVPNPTTYLWGLSTGGWNYDGTSTATRTTTSDLPPAIADVVYNATFLGVNNAYFANGSLPKSVLTLMVETKQALMQNFAFESRYYISASAITNYPDYTFTISEGLIPPADGSLITEWNFSDGTFNNTTGQNPVQATTSPGANISVASQELRVNNFPLSYTDPAGIILRTSTQGYADLDLFFDVEIGVTAANSLQFHYSIGNTTDWQLIPLNITTASSRISGILSPGIISAELDNNILRFKSNTNNNLDKATIRISLPTAVEDKADVYIRIATIEDPEVGDYETMHLSSVYSNVANINFDNIQFRAETVLPLTLTSFTASTTSQQVNLQWQTTNEINVDKFLVEKSTNGNNYTVVGTVTAQNKEANQYSYTTTLTQGNSYYRLKMQDKDGSYSYSNIVTVEGNTTTNQLKAYPSLVNNGNVVISHPKATTGTTITIYAINGAMVQQQKLSKDAVQTNLNVSALPAGSYKLIYSNNKTQQQTSFIKE